MDLPIAKWTPCGSGADPTSRLLADVPRLSIAGVNVHVQAYAVHFPGGVQDIVDEEFREDWQAICVLYDYCFETATIDGREYVLIAHPYGD